MSIRKLPLLVKQDRKMIRKLQDEVSKRIAKYSSSVRTAIKQRLETGDAYLLAEYSDGDEYPCKVTGNVGKREVKVSWDDGSSEMIKIEKIIDLLTEDEFFDMIKAEHQNEHDAVIRASETLKKSQ